MATVAGATSVSRKRLSSDFRVIPSTILLTTETADVGGGRVAEEDRFLSSFSSTAESAPEAGSLVVCSSDDSSRNSVLLPPPLFPFLLLPLSLTGSSTLSFMMVSTVCSDGVAFFPLPLPLPLFPLASSVAAASTFSSVLSVSTEPCFTAGVVLPLPLPLPLPLLPPRTISITRVFCLLRVPLVTNPVVVVTGTGCSSSSLSSRNSSSDLITGEEAFLSFSVSHRVSISL